MKRPLGCACLFFILFIRIFYACFPPALPDYSYWQSREVYICGRVISQKYQEINSEPFVVYTLDQVQLKESRAVNSRYLSDKSNSNQNTYDSFQNTQEFYQNINEHDDTDYMHQRIYCYASEEYPEVYIGSQIWIQGIFQMYESGENPGQFDSRLYYHMQGIGGSLQEARLVWSDGGKNIPAQLLQECKQYFLEKIDIFFSEKYGGVIKTILLGDKSDLDRDMKNLFQEGGILHILTISGLHISMLGMNCYRILRKIGMSQRVSAVSGMSIVLIYGAMIGTQAATFRAICMFSMQMTAILLGRTYDRLTGLSVAAVLLLLEQPMYVFYSGFLLSFGAVLGITILTPMVQQMCRDKGMIPEWLGKTFGGGLGVFLATFPIQLYAYYEYPVYSMLINAMVLPFLPFIVGLGAVTLALPETAAILAVPLVAGAEGLLEVYQWICRKSQSLPYHCLVLGAPKRWQILVYYSCLALIIWGFRRVFSPSNYGKILFSAALCVAFGVLLWRPVEGVRCSFLSVGQGDCAVVQYGKEAFVIDCGSTGKSNVGTQILLPFLKNYGISKVSGVFVSHADADHMNGIVQWLANYEHSHVAIGMLILPELEEAVLKEEFAELLELALQEAIPVVTIGAGDTLDLGELDIEVLYPDKGFSDTKDANEYSQVLLWSYNGQSILFTGDIAAEQEAFLSKQLTEENIVLLKAAHHGSKYSSSEDFLEICSPEHVVISYGVGNSYGHPHKDTVTRIEHAGAQLWYTGRQGAIMVEMTEQMEIYGFTE